MAFVGVHMMAAGTTFEKYFKGRFANAAEETTAYKQFLLGSVAPDTQNVTGNNETSEERKNRLARKAALHFHKRNTFNVPVWDTFASKEWCLKQITKKPQDLFFYLGFIHHNCFDETFSKKFTDQFDKHDHFHSADSKPGRNRLTQLQIAYQHRQTINLSDTLLKSLPPELPEQIERENFSKLFGQTKENLKTVGRITEKEVKDLERTMKLGEASFSVLCQEDLELFRHIYHALHKEQKVAVPVVKEKPPTFYAAKHKETESTSVPQDSKE